MDSTNNERDSAQKKLSHEAKLAFGDILYKFAFLFDENTKMENFSKIAGNKKWKYVRFDLEIKYKLFSTKSTNMNSVANNIYLPCNSFLTGYKFHDFVANPFRYDELNEIDDDDELIGGDIIILVRKPLPLGFDFYNPPKELHWAEKYATENEAMEAFINNACSHGEKDKKSIKCHASAFETSKMPIPHTKYICTNCWNPGHYRQYCQQIGQTDISMSTSIVKKPLPSGIPMTHFVKIDEETHFPGHHMLTTQTGHIIYYDKENNLYSLKNKIFTE
jgi:hypothetical protein